jgi:hypothetical protein
MVAGPIAAVRLAKFFVRFTVAVVVHPIAHLNFGAGQRVAKLLLPVDTVVHRVVAYSQPTRALPQSLVHQSVTVVIKTVANLHSCVR